VNIGLSWLNIRLFCLYIGVIWGVYRDSLNVPQALLSEYRAHLGKYRARLCAHQLALLPELAHDGLVGCI